MLLTAGPFVPVKSVSHLIHTLQGIYVLVEDLLEAVMVWDRSFDDIQCKLLLLFVVGGLQVQAQRVFREIANQEIKYLLKEVVLDPEEFAAFNDELAVDYQG